MTVSSITVTLSPETHAKMERIQKAADELGAAINDLTAGRDRSLAITNLDQATMWAERAAKSEA